MAYRRSTLLFGERGEERSIQLQDIKSDSPHTLSARTLLLEEHSLQPGDFISYYAKARDNMRLAVGRKRQAIFISSKCGP